MSRGQYDSSSIYPRRQSPDIFHNDPFKIQSYNFRYADKPVYPAQHYDRQQTTSQVKQHSFETYYQNPKFNEKNAESARSSTDVFQKRRRNYLRDLNLIPFRPKPVNESLCMTPANSRYQPQTNTPSSSRLSTSGNRIDSDTMIRGLNNARSNQNPNQDNANQRRGRSTSFCSLRDPDENFSTTTFKKTPKRSASTCSNCAIDIKINGLMSNSEAGNRFKIRIETDPCIQSNTDGNGFKVFKARKLGSIETFLIDKRRSKCSLAEKNPTCDKDTLLQVKSDRKYLEQVFQQGKLKEQQRLRERERELEYLKEMEKRERDRALKLKSESKILRSNVSDCEAQRRKEYERVYGQRQPMRALYVPTSVASPLENASQLGRPASEERFPGMVSFNVQRPTVNSSATRATQAERLQACTRNLKLLAGGAPEKRSNIKTPERRNSSTSNNNCNANVVRTGSKCSLGRPHERKLLNLHVNGVPVITNQPIHTHINNMPIRITTSQTTDENLRFYLNKVRNSSPASPSPKPDPERRRNCSSSRNSLHKSSESINVKINVYTDEVHPMRL